MSDLGLFTESKFASSSQYSESDTTETATITEPNTDETLSLDEIFHVLSNMRRRQTLIYLKQKGGEATLSEIAEHIAAMENDVSIRAINSQQRKRVYVSLYQCHLPKMDDMHIIAYNKNRGTVKLTDTAHSLNRYIGELNTTNLSRVYIGVLVLGAVLLATGGLGLVPLSLSHILAFVTLVSGLTISAMSRVHSE